MVARYMGEDFDFMSRLLHVNQRGKPRCMELELQCDMTKPKGSCHTKNSADSMGFPGLPSFPKVLGP